MMMLRNMPIGSLLDINGYYMKRFYSQSTGSTYLEGVHATMPSDAIEISESVFLKVIANPDPTKVRSHNKNGLPVLIDRPLPTPEELAIPERRWRDAELSLTDSMVARHRDQVEAEAETTLTPDQYKALQAYRSGLRDWPETKGFPDSTKRPVTPDWLSELL